MHKISGILLFICGFSFGQNHSLTVAVTGVKNNKGKITVELYNSKGKFLKSAFKTASSAITTNSVSLQFNDLAKSDYSVVVYHDENSNGKLDTNFIGMPKEPVACSNNAKGFMGPPKYEDAKFIIMTDSKITIKMNAKL